MVLNMVATNIQVNLLLVMLFHFVGLLTHQHGLLQTQLSLESLPVRPHILHRRSLSKAHKYAPGFISLRKSEDHNSHGESSPDSSAAATSSQRESQEGVESKKKRDLTEASVSASKNPEGRLAESSSHVDEALEKKHTAVASGTEPSHSAPEGQSVEKEESKDNGDVGGDGDTITGQGRTPQELTETDLKNISSREGLVALLSQGKDVLQILQDTLDGVDAVESLREVTEKVRDDIQKDAQALNRTIVEEYENIEHLRKLQDAQTAVLKSQLSFLLPMSHTKPTEKEEAEAAQTISTAKVASSANSRKHLSTGSWSLCAICFLAVYVGTWFEL